MRKPKISSYTLAILIFAFSAILFTTVIAFLDQKIFIPCLAITLLLIVFAIFTIKKRYDDAEKYISGIIHNLSSADGEILNGLKLPVMAVDKNGIVIWYNEAFSVDIAEGEAFCNSHISDLFGSESLTKLDKTGYAEMKLDKKFYTVYKNIGSHNSSVTLYYFVDTTAFKMITLEYKRSRPVVAIIMIDNISEILRDAKDSEKAVLTGEVENLLENWASNSTGFLRKLGDNRFIMVFEERHIRKYTEDNFDILNKVRNIKAFGRSGATLSIGIGRNAKTLYEAEQWAKQALDMSLGRGGDHVVIKDGENFEFFGGVSSGIESRTKVRSRVIASALKELIESCDTVLVMGHQFGDLDSLGASVGIRQIAKSLGKDAYIVTDKSKSLAKQLIKKIDETDPDAFIEKTDAEWLADNNTLLVIVDTHRSEFLEFKTIYDKADKVVVIDHHRKTVEHITNAVIFHHEPTASSASEMVAEIAQYMGAGILTAFDAEALLSGIMLDTRNFVLRTGVRTFEAAGYLRSLGANPVEVKRLFSSSLPGYKLKSEVVASAERYGNAAISIIDKDVESARIVASQAADELLFIEGVKSAYVLFKTGSTVNVSARSLGDVNVQLIMETLGGGGHQTMAAAQIQNSDFKDSKQRLCAAIDLYNKKSQGTGKEKKL